MLSTINRKGNVIHRSERICIDISDSVVSVIKLDQQGVMMRAGSAKAPTLPAVPDDAYVTDLSGVIKKAAWAAKVSIGFGASCVVVTSMPDMTIQRFRWPDMPADALLSIAAGEMTPYLPSGQVNYHVGCEVLGRVTDNGQPMLEMLAAAMPEAHAIAVDTACRWANFKPKRIDIRENARGRLVRNWCAPIEGAVPSTFAILDAGPGIANITFYHNGIFQSNRYFTPELVKLEEVQDFELLMSVKAGGIIDDNENAMRYDSHKLTEEIISAIDHFHRSMNGDRISCVLLMDDENIPGIEEGLRTGLNALVLKPSQWVKPGIKRPNLRRVDQDSFLDAFAVGMPAFTDHDCRMDLSNANSVTQGTGVNVAAAQATGPMPPLNDLSPDAVIQPAIDLRPLVDESAPSARTPQYTADPMPLADIGQLGHDDHYANHELPIPAGYVELPELPPEIAALELERRPLRHDEMSFDDILASSMREPSSFSDEISSSAHEHSLPPRTPLHHESPFDIISAKTDEHSGFPYAIPEDPPPEPGSKKPLFAAVAVAAVIFLIAIFVPLRTNLSLRAELRDLQESIAAYPSVDQLFMLNQERSRVDGQINAIRRDINRASARMNVVRDFYLRLPALVFIPEILEASGLIVDSISSVENAYEHQITISGRTNDFRGLQRGVEYLRVYSRHHYLLTVAFNVLNADVNQGVDQYGFVSYTVTVTVHPGSVPFWLNRYIERSWRQ